MNELIKKFRESCDYNIVLIGFMGAGKSTVARTLGEWFDMDIVEMDELISERQGMSIPEIFEKHGEEYFRNLETNLLIELQKASRTIISCGGGAAMRSQNVSEMKKNGYVVGSVGGGATLRLISDIPGVKYHEGRFLPYFFPDTFHEIGRASCRERVFRAV